MVVLVYLLLELSTWLKAIRNFVDESCRIPQFQQVMSGLLASTDESRIARERPKLVNHCDE